RAVADRAGVRRTTRHDIAAWKTQSGRTTYFFDVRTPEEYARGHIPGFLSIAGGQLVQETEMYAPVRGARLVLVDDDGVRANMTASWLAQMAWDVYVADDIRSVDFTEAGTPAPALPPLPDARAVDVTTLVTWLADTSQPTVVVDLSKLANYRKGHIPGAWFLIRSTLAESAANLPKAARYVLTAADENLARITAPELAAKVAGEVFVLDGGNEAWRRTGRPMETGEISLASPPIDRYRRPYEGTDVPDSAMQAYLDWEFGLIEQLRRDGTHHFTPMPPPATHTGSH
ncbi:MAG TPA: rhodanese-like domain-containing protein, partial [Hyphomicrobiaceae bacterium]|nr:rhodanese-like domain-containing protein [Hyphomicrobiaceae bacterium]